MGTFGEHWKGTHEEDKLLLNPRILHPKTRIFTPCANLFAIFVLWISIDKVSATANQFVWKVVRHPCFANQQKLGHAEEVLG
jgi:hypothetical protein